MIGAKGRGINITMIAFGTRGDVQPALVAPGGQYLIYSSTMDGGFGNSDLYITFRKPDGTWGPSINMGPQINTKAFEHFASLSPEGNYFFFCSERDGDLDVYWMIAAILDDLRRRSAVCSFTPIPSALAPTAPPIHQPMRCPHV